MNEIVNEFNPNQIHYNIIGFCFEIYFNEMLFFLIFENIRIMITMIDMKKAETCSIEDILVCQIVECEAQEEISFQWVDEIQCHYHHLYED